ncbi:MAG: complex I subunit 4 family protein [Phototrophicaceae bacterium]
MFPILSLIIFIPIVAGVALLFFDAENKVAIRTVALMTAFVVLALSAASYWGYLQSLETVSNDLTTLEQSGDAGYATAMFKRQLALEEYYEWLPGLGIAYHVGVDGLSAPMVLLTGMVCVTGVLISWRIEEQLREFMSFFLFLVAGVYGVFVSIDLFLLFFFYELALFPMYILIAGWGWVQLRQYAAMKLTIYILVGSVFALIGVIAMVIVANSFFTSPDGMVLFQSAIANGILPESANPFSFNIVQLMLAAEGGAFNVAGYAGIETLTFAKLWFPFIFIGFGVLAGIFPFHNWSPDGHVAAPTAVSMIHAGVLMKLGAFAALRVGVQLLPSGAHVHLPWIIFLTLINVVLGAFIAFRQRDFKYVIGFSSVSHMGLVSMGWASMNMLGMVGAGMQMFSHGAMTALFFGCVGMVYDRAHTRDIPSLGGFIQKMPLVGLAFIVGGLTSMGMPGFSGFIAEYPIFMGLFNASENITLTIGSFTLTNYYSWIALIAVIGIIITAAYVLRVTHQVFFGKFNAELYPDVGNIRWTDRIILLLLAVPLMVIGLYPNIMAPMVEIGLRPVLAILGG